MRARSKREVFLHISSRTIHNLLTNTSALKREIIRTIASSLKHSQNTMFASTRATVSSSSSSSLNNIIDIIYKLEEQLFTAAYAAFANGDGLEKSRDEIDRTVASLRKRLQARAAAVQAQQAPQAADGAGQSEQAALKRAGM